MSVEAWEKHVERVHPDKPGWVKEFSWEDQPCGPVISTLDGEFPVVYRCWCDGRVVFAPVVGLDRPLVEPA